MIRDLIFIVLLVLGVIVVVKIWEWRQKVEKARAERIWRDWTAEQESQKRGDEEEEEEDEDEDEDN